MREQQRSRGLAAGRWASFVVLAGAAVTLAASPADAPATPGDLDPSFDEDGIQVLLADPEAETVARDVAVQADAKVVAVGYAVRCCPGPLTASILLARYHPDGTLDPSFGGDGVVETRIAKRTFGEAVAIQPNGRIVVVGTAGDETIDPTSVAIARYLPSGKLDRSLAGDGTATVRFDRIPSIGSDVLLQPGGKIIAVGSTDPPGAIRTRNRRIQDLFGVARIKHNGELDRSFAGDGTRVLSFKWFGARTLGHATGVALQGAGNLVVTGSWSDALPHPGKTYIALARLKRDGALDRGFGREGRVLSDFSDIDFATDVAVDSTKRIVVVGESGTYRKLDPVVARYAPDGRLDPTFASGGLATVVFGYDSNGTISADANALLLQPDGKIALAGKAYESNAGYDNFALARLNSDGSPDFSFSDDGMATFDLASRAGGDGAFGLTLDGSERLIAVGAASLPNEHNVYYDRFSLIRILGASAP